MRPRGHLAVMEAHAPDEVAGDSAEQALHRRLNFFPTAPWAGRAGGELIAGKLDPGAWTCEEPACGEGHMVHGLAPYFAQVCASDVHAYDPARLGRIGRAAARQDFLGGDWRWNGGGGEPDWIVTNPPFSGAAEFVRLGLQRARRGVAIVARAAFHETDGRYDLLYGCATPMTLYAPFFERVGMTLGRWIPGKGTATAYAWYVWMRPELEPAWVAPMRAALGAGAGSYGIRPGTRDRLTRREDARLFGWRGEAPLLEPADP